MVVEVLQPGTHCIINGDVREDAAHAVMVAPGGWEAAVVLERAE